MKKTKLLTFLLAPTFIFLFSGSIFGQETAVKKEYWGRGKIKKSKTLQLWKDRRFFTIWHQNRTKHIPLSSVSPKDIPVLVYVWIICEKKFNF
ncbi:uncharacterized protein METZ01_LOCUS339891 [marine metagenome]|uniref:Uncharacterized protein n=1 Tax=marine metagenome TaxID=408172 RepID=A0A382QQ09_9ZZZZ